MMNGDCYHSLISGSSGNENAANKNITYSLSNYIDFKSTDVLVIYGYITNYHIFNILKQYSFQFSSVQSLSHVRLFTTP